MDETSLSNALGAADNFLTILTVLSPNVLSDTELQQRIRAIGSFKPTRKRKQPEFTRERRRPVEDFCTDVKDTNQARFISAARAAQDASWDKGSPLFTGFAFPQASDRLTTLLGWCQWRRTDATREMRILTVVVEAYIHEEAEVRGVPVKDITSTLSKKTGWTKGHIESLCKCGRWHMSILESENVGIGALALLGDKQYSAGTHLSSRTESISKFVQCCLEIHGFQEKSYDLAAYVYEGFQLCIRKLSIGGQALVLSPGSRLHQILSSHEKITLGIENNVPLHGSLQPSCQNLGVLQTGNERHRGNPSTISMALNFPPLRTLSFRRDQVIIPYQTPILKDVYNGDLAAVRHWIEECNVPINAVDPYGLGLGYYALYYCWRSKGVATALSIFVQLLSYRIEVEWPDEIGSKLVETLLDSYFMSLSKRECLREIFDEPIQQLVSSFADDWKTSLNRYLRKRSFSPLHRKLLTIDSSAPDDLEEFLRSASRDGRLSTLIDEPDAQGRTPLTWAVEYHHEEAARLLIQYGANVDHRRKTRDGEMPLLHLLCAAPKVPQTLVVLLLQAGCDVNSQDEEGWSVVHIAASWHDKETIVSIRDHAENLDLDIVNDSGQTARLLGENSGCNEGILRLLT